MKKLLAIISLVSLSIFGCSSANTKAEVKKPSKPAKNDSYIFRSRILHKMSNEYIVVNDEKNIRFFIKTRANDVEKINFVYIDGKEKELDLKYHGEIGLYDVYSVDVKAKSDTIKYYFKLEDGDAKYFIGEKSSDNKDEMKAFAYKIDKKQSTDIPKWAKEVVWYQIFTDRFRNGNKENDPIYNEFGPQIYKMPIDKLESGTPKSDLIFKERWNSMADKWNAGDFTINDWKSNWENFEKWEDKAREVYTWDYARTRHYGGDLQGVIDQLDYLKELGITAIWFNPVFYAESNHKYDAADFRHIAPSFGVIEQTGNNYSIDVSKDNKFGKVIANKKGDSEYKKLSYDIKSGKNGFGETSDPETWVWTQSDLLAVKMIEEAHKRGIRVIFDGVFNHTGNEFWAFTQCLIEGPKSKYADWYTFSDWKKTKDYKSDNIDEWNPGIKYSGSSKYGVFNKEELKYRRRWVETPKDASSEDKWEIYLWNKENVSYNCWWGFKSLPKLNHFNKEVGEHMINISKKWMLGPDGLVADKWQEDDGIDGWRLDVPLDIEDQEFWTRWKIAIREVKKDVYTVAEIWDEAFDHVRKEKFDAVMNYEFAKNVVGYVINKSKSDKLTASKFKAEMETVFLGYQDDASKAMQNLMDSHDTDRLFSMVINGEREYDRGNNLEEIKSYRAVRPDIYSEEAVAKVKIISLIQMTYLGAPMIYYGDELGMWGSDDPRDRKPMIWEDLGDFEDESDELEKYETIKSKLDTEIVTIDEAHKKLRFKVSINKEIEEWYKKIIKLRNENIDVFSEGEVNYLLTDDDKDCIAYERKLGDKIIVVVINNSNNELELKIPTENNGKYYDMFEEDKRYDLSDKNIEVKLDKLSATVIYRK